MEENEGVSLSESNERKLNAIKIAVAVICAVTIAAGCFFAGFFIREATLPQDVTSMKWALGIIEDNYYFYDDFDRDGAKNESLAAVASKLDKYSEYYTAEEYERQVKDNAGSKSGLGISYNFINGTGVRVVTVAGNSPAYIAGISAGDVFTGGVYKGGEVKFDTAEKDSSFFAEAEDNVEFTVNSAERSYTVAKCEYTASYACMATSSTYWDFISAAEGGLCPNEDKTKAMGFLPEDFAYIRLSQFYGTAANELGVLFEKFNSYGKKSMIIDLRNNGGGYVDVMCDIAGYFTSSQTQRGCVAMTAEYKNGGTRTEYTKTHKSNAAVSKDTDIYVLANSGTASASEALIGVLVSYGFLDYEDIFVSDFGEEYLAYAGESAKTAQTYGKGIMQTTYVNPFTHEALKLTTARILWPNGKCIHETALSAKDGCSPVYAEWTSTKDDSELKRVLEIIESKG